MDVLEKGVLNPKKKYGNQRKQKLKLHHFVHCQGTY
jgi:hypothetical protein